MLRGVAFAPFKVDRRDILGVTTLQELLSHESVRNNGELLGRSLDVFASLSELCRGRSRLSPTLALVLAQVSVVYLKLSETLG